MTDDFSQYPVNLAEALARLQTQLPEIKKASKAQYGSYANLTDVSKELMPILGSLGLSFTCQPTLDHVGDEQRFVLGYVLRHVSGEAISGVYPLPSTPSTTQQQIGSAITYGRRYCLCAVTGAVAEEDDDGQAASTPPTAQKPKRESPPRRGKDELPRNTDGSVSRSRVTDAELAATGQMTDAQLREHGKLQRDVQGTGPQGTERLTGTPADDPWYREPLPMPRASQPLDARIIMHFARFGISDRDVRLGYTATLAGRDTLGSTKELTAAEGLAVEKALARCKDREAFDRLLEEGVPVAQ